MMDVPRYAGEWPQIGQKLSHQGNEVNINCWAEARHSHGKRSVPGERGRRTDRVE